MKLYIMGDANYEIELTFHHNHLKDGFPAAPIGDGLP